MGLVRLTVASEFNREYIYRRYVASRRTATA